ncbi:MAG: hypothetical protein ACREEM_47730, partial [Blastocatellia bacterium]
EERRNKQSASSTLLSLNDPAELIYQTAEPALLQTAPSEIVKAQLSTPLPALTVSNEGSRTRLMQFAAAIGVELKLLGGERSLIVLAPLTVFLCCLELSPSGAAPVASVYAANSAQALLLILSGIALFYTGETMHRERECRAEPLLWSTPAPDWIFLLSKFASLSLISLALMAAVALSAIALHLYRDMASVALAPYLIVYTVILLPSLLFIIDAVITLHVILREKYLAHAVGLGIGGGLIYLLLQGHTNPLYNPALYRLWTYSDLTGSAPFRNGILLHRVYWLAITVAALALAHRFHPRVTTRVWRPAMTTAIAAILIAVIAGICLNR